MTGLPAHEVRDVDAAAASIRRYGVALMRGALPRPLVARVCEAVENVHRVFDELGEHAGREGLDKIDPVLRAVLEVHAQQTGFPLSVPVHLRLDGKVALLDMQLAVRASILFELAARVFGERPAILVDHCSARRQSAAVSRTGLGWHQDVEALAIGRANERGLTCWIPLVALDAATPSLEIWPRRVTAPLLHHRDINNYSILTEEPPVLEPGAESSWSARGMEPGDVLVFDAFTLHRTAIEPGQTKPRHSIDLRMRPLSETGRFESAILT
jgi:hypothetical protein